MVAAAEVLRGTIGKDRYVKFDVKKEERGPKCYHPLETCNTKSLAEKVLLQNWLGERGKSGEFLSCQVCVLGFPNSYTTRSRHKSLHSILASSARVGWQVQTISALGVDD